MGGSTMLDKQLQAALDRRRKKGTLRRLTTYETVSDAVQSTSTPGNSPISSLEACRTSRLVDFSSNDYMGLGHSNEMRQKLISKLQQSYRYPLGSTGSRLLDGNSLEHEQLEERLAVQFGSPSALLFNSGFDANVSLFSTLPQSSDYILYDCLVHASVHDGIRASRTDESRRLAFEHSNLDDLGRILDSIKSHSSAENFNIFIALEAVYSMDGDLCPLTELTELLDSKIAKERRCIIVDEAHAVGLYGLNGAGLIDELGLRLSIDIRLATFGKALGCAGAAVLCSPLVRQYLINYARPLIYSTAIPHPTLLSINSALDILATPNGVLRATKTFSLTQLLLGGLHNILSQQRGEEQLSLPTGLSKANSHLSALPLSPIIPLLSSEPRALADHLIRSGYLVRPICYPTVPKGSERVRICVHSHNETEDVAGLVRCIQAWLHQHQQDSRSKL